MCLSLSPQILYTLLPDFGTYRALPLLLYPCYTLSFDGTIFLLHSIHAGARLWAASIGFRAARNGTTAGTGVRLRQQQDLRLRSGLTRYVVYIETVFRRKPIWIENTPLICDVVNGLQVFVWNNTVQGHDLYEHVNNGSMQRLWCW